MNTQSLTLLTEITGLLMSTGPWGLIVLLGWSLIKKEREANNLVAQLIKLSEKQTSATIRMETAIRELKEALFASVSFFPKK